MIKIIIKLLPNRLHSKIENQHGLMLILNNISWLFFDKFLRMGIGLVVGLWIARYLGPKEFGLLNYSIAFVAMFTAIANLGLNSIVVRDLVIAPQDAETIMGTSFVLSLVGGFSAFGLSFIAINYIRPNEPLVKLIVALLALSMVLKATDVVRYWFESQIQSKFVVWTENVVFFAFSAVKIGLIFVKAPLIAFVCILLAENFMVALGLILLYVLRDGELRAWQVSFKRAKHLLNDSWPLILSGLSVMVYMRIDQIMLGQMLGNESVGIYSAAVKVSEIWYFIPMTIMASTFPSIIEAKKISESKYYGLLQKLYDIMVLIAVVVAIPMTFFSNWIVELLFGQSYHEAGPVLAIHIWAGIFVFLGVASGKWFLIENLQKFAFYRTVFGVGINIGANLFFIPKNGAIGAAYATIISQLAAAYVFDIINLKTRTLFWMKTRALFSPFYIKIRRR